jgi:hypothetical protein
MFDWAAPRERPDGAAIHLCDALEAGKPSERGPRGMANDQRPMFFGDAPNEPVAAVSYMMYNDIHAVVE